MRFLLKKDKYSPILRHILISLYRVLKLTNNGRLNFSIGQKMPEFSFSTAYLTGIISPWKLII